MATKHRKIKRLNFRLNSKKVIKHKKKIALVLSGGGVKAASFHVGVMLALKECGFEFAGGMKDNSKFKKNEIQLYVGSSAGSFIGALIASGYTPEDLIYSFLNPRKSKLRKIDLFGDIFTPNLRNLYKSFSKFNPINFTERLFEVLRKKSLESIINEISNLTIGSGIFSTSGLEAYIREAMSTNDFRKLRPQLFIIGTFLDKPAKVNFGPIAKKIDEEGVMYVNTVPISEAVATSCALPLLFSPYPVKINGKYQYMVDGEIKKTLSTYTAKEQGADLIIASYTHQPWDNENHSLIDYGVFLNFIQVIYIMINDKIELSDKFQKTKEKSIKVVEDFLKEKINEYQNNGDSTKSEVLKEVLKELPPYLKQRLDYRQNLDYIFIAPNPKDMQIFKADHFNLNPYEMRKIMAAGYKAAQRKLKEYKFYF